MVRIGTVTMQDGTLAFTDHHVTGGYTTTLFNLGGRISGLSSEENRFADVDLRGNLENQSPLRITGRINPLRDDLFADLKVSFTDIELSPMTPYSGTYLGYAVDKGKLFLDSRYRIENRKLDSENKVFIDQLHFGKRIESDKATNLPVRLAVALLKDRKGEIRLDLPVTGRTDDPQFSVWRVVLKILKNLVVKAANSPFTLLQSMFGGKEDLSSVGFAYGSAELSPGEREKLLKLATALNDRPALKIGVVGFVDRERDDEGYRNELLLKKMRAEKFRRHGEEEEEPAGRFPRDGADRPRGVRQIPEGGLRQGGIPQAAQHPRTDQGAPRCGDEEADSGEHRRGRAAAAEPGRSQGCRGQGVSRQAGENGFSAGLPEERGHLPGAGEGRGTREPGRVRGCGRVTS